MVHLRRRNLELRFWHEFRIARGAASAATTLLVELEHCNLIGRGEAIPVETYGQGAAAVGDTLDRLAARLAEADPSCVESLMLDLLDEFRGQESALCAVDGALWDLAGQLAGQPVWRLFGLDAERAGLTCMTLGMADLPTMLAKADEAAEFPILKVKCGGPQDLDILRALRDHTGKRFWIDANEGWSVDQAASLAAEVAALGVEMIEQPVARDDLDGLARVREVSPIPVVVDESCLTAADVPRLAGVVDGVNVKLHKCGGLTAARHLIATARACGLRVMTGCFCASSVAMTQAAQIAPLVDWSDLDGHLLVANDPFRGYTAPGGRITLPHEPGLGLAVREAEPAKG